MFRTLAFRCAAVCALSVLTASASRAGAVVAGPSPETNPFAPTLAQVQARFDRIQREVDRLRSAGRAADADRIGADLRHFRDELAGSAPSAASGPELDFVGVNHAGTIPVRVGPNARPIVLALGSVEPGTFDVTLLPGAQLDKVIVFGRNPVAPSNLPAGVPVQLVPDTLAAYQKDYTDFPATARLLNGMTGLPLSSFQGRDGGDGARFDVGGGGASEWAAQRVLSEVQPLYDQATAFELRQQRAVAQAGPYRFAALYRTYSATGELQRTSIAGFSPLGPDRGTISPPVAGSGADLSHIAYDPRDSTYYGVGPTGAPFQLGTSSGRRTTLPTTNSDVIRQPTGLTFDSARNRLVVSTNAGEGFLYQYAPEQHLWVPLASLNGVDVYSLTYSASDDLFYALTGDNKTPSLLRFSSSGYQLGFVPLSQIVPGTSMADYQLTAAGDRLSLLSPAVADLYVPYLRPQVRSYLIDPHTGVMTYLGTVVPEPGGIGVVCACVGAIALRRRRRRNTTLSSANPQGE